MCGTICSNDATFSSGTTIAVPVSFFGSIRSISFVSATIEVYSVPCAPDTNATTRPGLAPLMTATWMVVPESLPAGTTSTP